MNSLKEGDIIPEFSLREQNGNIFDIKSVLGRKNIVIYFYPKDSSPGCTRQACNFRDHSDAFDEAGAVVIGISGQSVESHKVFADKYNLVYPLLSDTGNKVRKMFGVPSSFFGLIPGRVTYVANKQGKIISVYNSQTKIDNHIDEAFKVALMLKKDGTGQKPPL